MNRPSGARWKFLRVVILVGAGSLAGRRGLVFRNSLYRHRISVPRPLVMMLCGRRVESGGDHAVGRHGGGGRGGGERSGHGGRISRVDRDVRSIGRYPQLRMRCP
jgi:hypothetical protein